MKFLLYAQVDKNSIGQQLGAADYSYFFLLRAFGEVLADLGDVVTLSSLTDVDILYKKCQRRGERCVLLSFAPPHKTPLQLKCPVVPVFAWEYPEIPERIEERCWQGDPRHDWRYVFAQTGRAIALSNHTVAAVQRSMGTTYAAIAIPSPIRPHPDAKGIARDPSTRGDIWLKLAAGAVDSHSMGLDPDGIVHPDNEDGTPVGTDDLAMLPVHLKVQAKPDSSIGIDTTTDPSRQTNNVESVLPCDWSVPLPRPISLRFRGVVYTCVITPAAGRKNWEDLITAFCWTFSDNEDATLVLKLAGKDLSHCHLQLLMMLTKLSPFRCRVVAIYGYLSDSDYAALIDASTYYVNTSLCEGLCLPLVEFLNAGVPAVAPDNTAMADYISADLAFVVDSYPGVPTMWPHGDNEVNRTSYHQLNWQSLTEAYRDSYEVALRDPFRYQRMSTYAKTAMQRYCGFDSVRSSLHAFLCPEVPLRASVEETRTAEATATRVHAP